MKILLLGSTGFVGRNLFEDLSKDFTVLGTSRISNGPSVLRFDVSDRESWPAIVECKPDVIINSIAYGVVKNEVEHEQMFNVNYLDISDFYHFVMKHEHQPFWLQIGTAFEYDLSVVGGITEESACVPRTYYGISKLMFSKYLITHARPGNFVILRPFGMFGKYEDISKFFPMLITAQKEKQTVKLSSGVQERDYFFVGDLGAFIRKIIIESRLGEMPPVVNLGCGIPTSFKKLAGILATVLPDYDERYWQWSEIPMRANESRQFYNASGIAKRLGFNTTVYEDAFKITANHYLTTK